MKLVEFDNKYFSKSWDWLNDEEVKKLTNTPDFTKESQLKWFNSLKSNKEYRIWGVEIEGLAVGCAGLKRITDKDACVFWYIGEKQSWGKGIGTKIANEISKKAKELNLEFLYGEPLLENIKSINLLFKEGYKISEFHKDYYIMIKPIS